MDQMDLYVFKTCQRNISLYFRYFHKQTEAFENPCINLDGKTEYEI